MVISGRIAGENAKEYALRELKENIVSCELKPGTAVSENELADQMGISRTPVREALSELVKVSIIEIYPQRGSFVSLIDPDLVEEARFMRRVLDTEVIKIACDTATERDIAIMEENVQLQEFYLEKVMPEKILGLDNEFHRLIYSVAKKDLIYEIRSTMMLHFDRVRTLSVEAVKDIKIVKDHREMLEAIKTGDKTWAGELVDKHMARYNVDAQMIRDQHPDFFK